MTNPNFDDEHEKPLDPALEKVRRKMMRLLFISGAAILIALMAVISALVYKAKNAGSKNLAQQDAPFTSKLAENITLSLPQGFAVTQTGLSGDRLLVTGTLAGETRLLVFDLASGKRLSEITFSGN